MVILLGGLPGGRGAEINIDARQPTHYISRRPRARDRAPSSAERQVVHSESMTALPRRTTTAARSYRVHGAVLATAAGVLALLGCSPWTQQTPSGVTLLKPPRMSPDSVVLEMALVDITTDAQLSVGELWRRADEQVLSLEARRALLQHGFRCGVLGTQLPQWLTHLLELQAERPKLEPDGGTVVVGEHLAQRRLQVAPECNARCRWASIIRR